LLANVGVNPIIGQNWINLNGIRKDIVDDKYLQYSVVDGRFEEIDFRNKDISNIVTIEIISSK
jgi:hypothetical protein